MPDPVFVLGPGSTVPPFVSPSHHLPVLPNLRSDASTYLSKPKTSFLVTPNAANAFHHTEDSLPTRDMTRKGPRTVDLVARIGLKAPAMNNRKDIYDLLPCVSELYQVDIVDLCKKYAREDKNGYAQAVEMKDDADKLLDKYGPRIWTREKRRPWLFIAGKHELFGGHKEYPKDLYFDDPDHHKM